MAKNLLISFVEIDLAWLNRLKDHLSPYARLSVVKIWDRTMMLPGENHEDSLRKSLIGSEIAIILLSASYLASEYVHTKELPLIIDAAQKNKRVWL